MLSVGVYVLFSLGPTPCVLIRSDISRYLCVRYAFSWITFYYKIQVEPSDFVINVQLLNEGSKLVHRKAHSNRPSRRSRCTSIHPLSIIILTPTIMPLPANLTPISLNYSRSYRIYKELMVILSDVCKKTKKCESLRVNTH